MANVAGYKTKIQAWGKEREAFRVRYDFSQDGGAQGFLGLFDVEGKHIIESAKMVAVAAVTSDGSATISVGKSGDAAGVIAATGKADLEINEVAFGAAQDASHVLADGDVIGMTIGTADLTAGIVDFLFELQKAS